MNKWATITGSSNGIGAALAETFARNGYSIKSFPERGLIQVLLISGIDDADIFYIKTVNGNTTIGINDPIIPKNVEATDTEKLELRQALLVALN